MRSSAFGRLNRDCSWRMVSPVTGSRQSAAIIAAGVRTNPRKRRPGWGMDRAGLLSAQMPPDHNNISRSSTRARQLCPVRARPKWDSTSSKRPSRSGGDSCVETTAAAFANRRDDGPMGRDWIVAECANTSISSISSAATTWGMIRSGEPINGCGWFDPMPMRYRCDSL